MVAQAAHAPRRVVAQVAALDGVVEDAAQQRHALVDRLVRQRPQRHVVRVALDHAGFEALGDPPALLQQRRLHRGDARDVERRQAFLADVRQQVALQAPLDVCDRARAPLEHVVLKPARGEQPEGRIVVADAQILWPLPGAGADRLEALLERDQRTTGRPALAIGPQTLALATAVDGHAHVVRAQAVLVRVDVNRPADRARHASLLVDRFRHDAVGRRAPAEPADRPAAARLLDGAANLMSSSAAGPRRRRPDRRCRWRRRAARSAIRRCPEAESPRACAACACTQSRWRPRICATWPARSRPTWPPGVRAASVSNSISSSGARATDIGAHLSQRARSRPPTTSGAPRARSGRPTGRQHRRTRRRRVWDNVVPNSRQNPAGSGCFRSPAPRRAVTFSLQIGYICAELIALHTREVAGSKPAAPMHQRRWK